MNGLAYCAADVAQLALGVVARLGVRTRLKEHKAHLEQDSAFSGKQTTNRLFFGTPGQAKWATPLVWDAGTCQMGKTTCLATPGRCKRAKRLVVGRRGGVKDGKTPSEDRNEFW